MTKTDSTIDSLRAQIDGIDDQIHDLVMARCALVERIGGLKGAEPLALRPGREAQIMRRLVSRHAGTFPLAALARIWREMIGALVGLQRPLTVAVTQPEKGAGYIDLARSHFGTVWPVRSNPSVGQVVKMVAEEQAGIGIVPVPGRGRDGDDPWWVGLTAGNSPMPRVVIRLPFFPVDPIAGNDPLEALVIANRPHDDTGHDRTLMVIETESGTSRDRTRGLVASAGFVQTETLATHTLGDIFLQLIEVEGWVGAEDPRIAALVHDPISHATIIGGYAVPMAP